MKKVHKKYQIAALILVLFFIGIYIKSLRDFVNLFDIQVAGLPLLQFRNIYRNVSALVGGAGSEANKKIGIPFAVVIDNHSLARPVEGLQDASIVYEVIVEGDITRFMAIFDNTISTEQIGPVRSARPYLVDWAQEWDSMFFHSGGSPEALALLKENFGSNINEISADGKYFWRDTLRLKPHNLFTSSDLMREAIKDKRFQDEVKINQWLFKDDLSSELLPENTDDIVIDFSVPQYSVQYKYNRQKNNYIRFLDSEYHRTGKEIQLTAKNVVVQYVEHTILDEEGRLKVTTTGKGKAVIYQDGKKINGFWQTKNKRTRFYNAINEEILFNRGSIWVEVVFEGVKMSE